MTVLEILEAYWKEGLLYLVLGAGLIQISPIKINPLSWIAKKLGNALNADVIKQLDETKKALEDLDNKFKEHIVEIERDRINECRRRILNFNEKLIDNEIHNITRERYNSILDDIDMYEKYCLEHPDYPNSKAVLSIKNIKEDYLQRFQS